ncbi:MAG TPA: acyl-CoA dehydrogenase family protein [Acidimicrobiales bacterium]|nr:acyl-CoA dehydrogenase family protein [Acidimicrobiales bacterium]
MDFGFGEEAQAVAESAGKVFAGLVTPQRVAEVERSEDRFDAQLWAELAKANLLGIAVPTDQGGSGLGLVELAQVLEAQGRAVAPVPLWATCVLGAMPIARFGSPAHKARWLGAVAAGETRLSAALTEVAARGRPEVRAEPDGSGGLVLSGHARAVPQAHLASAVLVPVITGAGTAVVLVDPRRDGVAMERAVTTDRQVHPHLRFDTARVAGEDVLAGPDDGDEVVEWTLQRARTGLCAIALGVCEEAVRRTAAFLNERRQFGRPLSSFQATMLRAADAYIDTEAIRVTLWDAAWRLDTRRRAEEAVASAMWWASEAGQRVVHATQHLHGGMGADVEYPIHRYFLWGKQIELMLGGPSAELARLGSLLSERVKKEVVSADAGA